MKIDTKYTSQTKDRLFFECKKHDFESSGKATHIWYISTDTQYTYLIKRSALCALAQDGRKTYVVNKDPLIDFSIDELDKDDYYIIDMRKVL